MTSISRRSVLVTGALLTAAGASSLPATAAPPPASPMMPQPVALPFMPSSLGWLSERLIVSHHDNNYAGAVKRLGQIRGEWEALDPTTAPGYRINGLKREELIAWNSMILHELYFAGLGAPSAPDPALARAIERDFGSHDRWASEFSGMGKALGGGSGWVLLVWSSRDKRLVNQWAADHTMALAASVPLLALDMYEHAYAMDFGAKAAAYVDGFMHAINWSNTSKAFGHLMA